MLYFSWIKHCIRLLACLLLVAGLGKANLALAAAEEVKPVFIPPGIELPDGEGKGLILRACTSCHDLKGMSLFKGYWGSRQWLDLVRTMKEHGARLDDGEMEQAAEYLATHFGRLSD